MKFSLIIPTIRETALVADCVKSIRKFETNQDQYEIIVVDDGSDSYVQTWLGGFCRDQNITLITKTQNQGFAHSVNMGLRVAKGDYFVLVNNDVTWTKPILSEIEKAFMVHPDIGIVGAKLLYPDGRVQHAGVIRAPRSMTFVHVNKFMRGDNVAVNRQQYFVSVTGALFAIKKEAYQAVGDFNERYFIAAEDCEYCVRSWLKGFRVFYAPAVEAIHIEGYTRGNDTKTKMKKGPEWAKKEMETFAKFYQDMSKINLESLEQAVFKCNQEIAPKPVAVAMVTKVVADKKLEIGCGTNPQPGYLHLDVRKLPHVEYVCDFSKDKLPFENGEVAEILANHVIEHISWRQLPFVISEWRRVLAPGGKIFLRTPDLEFICRTYLDGKTTPEHPNDENYIKQHLSNQVTPAWWANIKLFAGQDYPSNYHFHCFDFVMLRDLLQRYGFESVSRVQVQPVFSPGELQVEAFRISDQPKTVLTNKMKVLVKRKGALGDTLLTTPIVARLRRELPEDAEIHVATDCGAAYINNPHINALVPFNVPDGGYNKVINLDLAYERNPKMHIVDAYSFMAFGEANYDKSIIFNWTDSDEQVVGEWLQRLGVDPRKTIVAHMATSWRNRTWSKERWESFAKLVVGEGGSIVVVGSGGDISFVSQGVYDLKSKLTLHQIAALISRCACFVAIDSGLTHVAGATQSPIVCMYTSAKGEYRVPFRNGEYGSKCIAVSPNLPCIGCLHEEPPPVVFCDCRRGDFACLAQITPSLLFESVKGFIAC